MKKVFTKTMCLALSAMTVLSMVGCGDEKNPAPGVQVYDTESRPLVFSTSALDGNFNPFFATAATDVTIVAQTQISMLTTDKDGNVACGDNYATVAKAYKVTTNSAGDTEYEFVIKNGIKFSDGQTLDIDDVLFNLYVYLDPMYMGSSTIYSTKIKGLEAYRTQDPDAVEGSSSDAEASDGIVAMERISRMMDVLETDGLGYDPESDEGKDIELMKQLYHDAVKEEWTAYASLESYETDYRFTEEWQAFYFAQGFIKYQYEETNVNGNVVRKKRKATDAKGEYFLTTLDANKKGEVESKHLIDDINSAVADTSLVSKYMTDNSCDEATAKSYIKRDTAIEYVYESNTTSPDNLMYVLSMQSGGKLYEKFVADAMAERLGNQTDEDGSLLVDHISGISTYATTSFDGKDLGASHDVLKIVIDGVDPKAIWNFAFTVAPMHYYSTAELAGKANRTSHFGVDFGNKDFFEKVLQATAKNRLPMGAGTYMATNMSGADLSAANDDGTQFFKNNWVYYKRNPYFETVGSGLCNAKIKYMRYKVVASDQILNSIINEEIDVGEPNATQTNINRLGGSSVQSYLGYNNYLTNGYGYVGINPKFVPNIKVRRAIMHAMDVSKTIVYYTEALATRLHRPMSITSWAYPDDATAKYPLIRDASKIKEMVKGVDASELKLTFTIAGETTDHPAYTMFQDAADFLNEKCGFDIDVVTDVSALKKLATGNLAVWAAAWSSPLDPDMYQVYHKDSKATSVKNWGYDEIVKKADPKFSYENDIIVNELSPLIDIARETNNQTERKEYYKQALDLVMDLAIELPTYQRNDLVVYNKKVINTATLNTNPSHTAGVFDRLWEVNYN